MKVEKKNLLCSLLLLLVMVLTGFLWQPTFYLNDDITMRSILSGAYTGTPNGHAVYMQYPLTGLLAILYIVLPGIEWMELFFAGCIWICMSLVASKFSDKLLGGLLAAVLFLPFYFYMHYTIVAALLAGCAIFLLCHEKPKNIPLVLLWVAYMIRSQVGLLALPFVLAAWVWKVISQKKENRKAVCVTCGKQLTLLLVGLALISVLHSLCYSSENWKEYLRYNESRTQLYDYTDFLSTNQYGTDFASYGMSKQEYELLISYNTMLEHKPDAGKLQEIADKITAGMQKRGDTGWKEALQSYYLQVRYQDAPYNYLWLFGYILLAIFMIWTKDWLSLGFLGILGVGRSSIWIFLMEQGRFPQRVSISLYLLELMLLLALVKKKKEVLRTTKIYDMAIGTAYLCLLLLCASLLTTTHQKISNRLEVQVGWELLKAHCEEYSDRTYLMDVFSSVSYADSLYEEDAANLMLLGGWLTGSPLTDERLKALGGTDAAEVLYYNKDARLVVDADKDISRLENYMRERFGECRLVPVETVDWKDGGFFIYEVQTDVAKKETM